ncbi:MAG: DUF3352 domain-containing protein [Nocardioides sp.]|uniref:DUF3352 domain-containing protein n=1 Tax=Nocardioides sp. TaxID=35761 RepID=UPI003266D5C8
MSNTTPPGPGGPEFLESSAGSPVVSEERSTDNRKRLLALGGLVGVLAVGGGAVWTATSFLSTGAQPAEAMPAGTLGYVSIDLDPSGGQKIEAIQTLRKFPAFKEEIGLETDDDLREKLFEEIVKSGECEGLDYAKDVEPWLGDRAAVGAADLGGDTPAPIVVVQVKDAGKAEAGLDRLLEVCGGGVTSDAEADEEMGGWVVSGDWVVISQTEADAQKVVDATEEGSLAEDADFKRWTAEAGEPGIMSMYAAPAAGEYMSRYLGDMAGMGAAFGMPVPGEEFDSGSSGFSESMPGEEPSVPPEIEQALADFDGAAATMRFDDGAVELEMAYSDYQKDLTENFLGAGGVEMVEGLPDDTVAAFGLGFTDGWAQAMLDYLETSSGDAMDMDELIAEAEAETGLDLPADIETLLGEGIAVGLGSGIDADAIVNGGPEELPLGIKINGDPQEIQAVLDKVKDLAGSEAAPYFEVTESDGFAVLATNDEYRAAMESGGSLGETEAYDTVIEDDAVSVLFVNFNGDDD